MIVVNLCHTHFPNWMSSILGQMQRVKLSMELEVPTIGLP